MSLINDEIDVAARRAVGMLGLGITPEGEPLPDEAWRSITGADESRHWNGPRWDRLLATAPSSSLPRSGREMPSLSSVRESPSLGRPSSVQPTFFKAPEREASPSSDPLWQELAFDEGAPVLAAPTGRPLSPAHAAGALADEIDLG